MGSIADSDEGYNKKATPFRAASRKNFLIAGSLVNQIAFPGSNWTLKKHTQWFFQWKWILDAWFFWIVGRWFFRTYWKNSAFKGLVFLI